MKPVFYVDLRHLPYQTFTNTLFYFMIHNNSVFKENTEHLQNCNILHQIRVKFVEYDFKLHRFIILYQQEAQEGPLSLTWVQSTLQKFDFLLEPKTTTLHPTCFKITAMHSVCCYNLLGWRSFCNVPPSLMDWPVWQFLFTFRPNKHKLGRGR